MKYVVKKVILIAITFCLLPTSQVWATEATLKPLSILLLGIDNGSQGRVDQGRSDVMMVATLNPNTHNVTLTSIPRDTYTEIVGEGFKDKINHAYAFGGASMAIDSINHLLKIELDHFIAVNMAGLEDIVDAVGGVEVIPPTSFTLSGFEFVEGKVTNVNGEQALAYTRERYTSGGDYARQERQRELIQAIAKKLVSMNTILNVQKVLSSMQSNIQTDLNMVQLIQLYSSYKEKLQNFESHQLIGYGEMIDGIYYDIPDEKVLEETIQRLNQELN